MQNHNILESHRNEYKSHRNYMESHQNHSAITVTNKYNKYDHVRIKRIMLGLPFDRNIINRNHPKIMQHHNILESHRNEYQSHRNHM